MIKRIRYYFTGTMMLVIGTLGICLSNAKAATYLVTNTNNSGNGSLRAAIIAANSSSGADVINFSQGLGGTITLDGLINISDDLTINGNGQITVSGNDVTGIFEISDLTTALKTVTMRGLRLINGIRAAGTGTATDFTTSNTLFGGISSRENLTLENIDFDSCIGGLVLGTLVGAPAQPSLSMTNCRFLNGRPITAGTTHRPSLWVLGGNATTSLAGSISINNCVFDNNTGNVLIHSGNPIKIKNSSFTNNVNYGSYGAGLYMNPNNNVSVATVELENNTFAFNQTTVGQATGGVAFFNIAATTSIKITNCTIYKNTGTATTYGSQLAYTGNGTYNVSKSIIYGDEANIYGPGNITGNGYTINFTDCILGPSSGAQGGTVTANNISASDPKLAAVAAYNGGFVKTLAFTDDTSPAINFASSASAPTLDSRGFTRDLAGAKVDAGAYERGSASFSFLGTSIPPKNTLNASTDGVIKLTYGSPVLKGAGNIYVYEAPATLLTTIPVGNSAVSISGSQVQVTTGTLSPNKQIYLKTDAGVFTYTADGVTATSTAINDDQTIIFTTGNATVLPVTLTSFTVKAEGNRAKLQWDVKSELNNKEFLIYRSDDAKNWVKIGTVPSGNTYSLYDLHPLNGINYYQLAQVDLDGAEKSLEVKELRFTLQEADMLVYPNPTKGPLSLHCKNIGLLGSTAVLSDIQGKVLLKLTVGAQQELNLAHFPVGTYFLKYVNGKTLKLVKQ